MTHQNAIIPVNLSGQGRPYVTLNIQSMDGTFKPIKAIFDSGNDITLINEDSARFLGLDHPEVLDDATPFKVQGIAKAPLDFFMVKRLVKIEGMNPVWMKIGIGGLKENLLGREDLFDNFDVSLSKKAIRFTQLHTNSIGIEFPAGGIRGYTPGELAKDRTRLDKDFMFAGVR
jgi:hypothetical protein